MSNPRRNPEAGKWVIPIILLFAAPQLAIFIGIIWLIITLAKKNAPQQKQSASTSQRFDDCPQPLFCFHKDKGEHHVRKGKEIDPWDRPDIDISKYQRNR